MTPVRLLMIASILVGTASAQVANVQINHENKTISVTADHTLTVEPDIALVQFGYRDTAAQKDGAYRENVRISAEILKALEGAGVKGVDISTESLQLERQEQKGNQIVKPEL